MLETPLSSAIASASAATIATAGYGRVHRQLSHLVQIKLFQCPIKQMSMSICIYTSVCTICCGHVSPRPGHDCGPMIQISGSKLWIPHRHAFLKNACMCGMPENLGLSPTRRGQVVVIHSVHHAWSSGSYKSQPRHRCHSSSAADWWSAYDLKSLSL